MRGGGLKGGVLWEVLKWTCEWLIVLQAIVGKANAVQTADAAHADLAYGQPRGGRYQEV